VQDSKFVVANFHRYVPSGRSGGVDHIVFYDCSGRVIAGVVLYAQK